MRYIHLNDDSYILHMSKGMITLTRKSFNFNRIKHLLKKGAEEVDILPLLIPPKLDDGIYQANLIVSQNIMYISHLKETADGLKLEHDYLGRDYVKFLKEDVKCLGVYTSKLDIITDWPEYTI